MMSAWSFIVLVFLLSISAGINMYLWMSGGERNRRVARLERDKHIAELERSLLPALPPDASPSWRYLIGVLAGTWIAERYRRR